MSGARPTWRRLILPDEHGVWGLLAGAVLVGLPLGHTLGGLGLVVAAVAAICCRQAASRFRAAPRRAMAVLLVAGAVALTGAAATWLAVPGAAWLAWCAASAVLAAVPTILALRGSVRRWWASALAGLAFGALGGAIAAAGGARPSWSAVAAAALGAHLVAIVPLVRAQARPDPRWARLAIEVHLVIGILGIAGWAAGCCPIGIPLILNLGLARCLWLVDKRITMSTPARIGLREMAWLPVLAACVVTSLRLGGA